MSQHDTVPEDSTNEDVQTDQDNSNNADLPDSICPVYADAMEEWGHLFDGTELADPGCGHVVDLIGKNLNTRWQESTTRLYSYKFRMLIDYLHERGLTIEEATVDDLVTFVEHQIAMGKAKGTIAIFRSMIIHLLKHIKFRRDASTEADWDEVAELLKLRNFTFDESIEREPLSKDEVRKLFHAMNSLRDKLIVHTFVETGMRQVDLRKLRVEWVDFNEQEIDFTNTKLRRTHTLPLSDQLAMRLKYWVKYARPGFISGKDEEYLFPTQTGRQLSSSRVRNIVRYGAERAGIQETLGYSCWSKRQAETFDMDRKPFLKVSPHALRHTFKKLLQEKEVDDEYRRWAMDHKSSSDAHEKYGDDEKAYEEFKKALPLITFDYSQ